MILFDALRPPSALDPSAAAYKDWLHLNLLDHASGSVGLINVSLHGDPRDPRSRAVGTALVHVPSVGWVGDIEVRGIGEASIESAGVLLESVALAVDHRSGTALASAHFPDQALRLRLEAAAGADVLDIEQQLPLGRGWISWYVVPRLHASGTLAVGDLRIAVAGASAYHDHNWGRWHWGEDLGWEWGAFLTPAEGPAFVLARTSDRAHLRPGSAVLVVETRRGRRTFAGACVEIAYSGTLASTLRRVPGALAALHADRAVPRLPARLTVRAGDGYDNVVLEFEARAAAQLIAGDPAVPGYGFLHEIVGEFTARGRVAGLDAGGAGLAVVEYVN